MTLNIAHRGGAGLQPENSLAAFRDAVARGCDGAELDVQLSRDGQVIVYHDYRLSPDTTRREDGQVLERPTPRLKDLTVSDLQTFDIGRIDPRSAYATAHPSIQPHDGERIPTLAAVIAVAKGAARPFRLLIELKTSSMRRNLSANPVDLAAKVVALLKEEGFVYRATLVGFDWPALLHAKALAPEIQCWFTTYPQSWFRPGIPPAEDHPPSGFALRLMRYWAETGQSPWAGGFDAVNHEGSILKAIRAAGGVGWLAPWRDATPESVRQAHDLGLKVCAWTVNDPITMRECMAVGLDAICTDRPDLLADLLKTSTDPRTVPSTNSVRQTME